MKLTTPRKSFSCLIVAGFALVVACGSSGEIGESCSTEGSAEGCVAGAICGKAKDVLVCLKRCSSQADCPANSNCNGTKGDAKACQSNL